MISTALLASLFLQGSYADQGLSGYDMNNPPSWGDMGKDPANPAFVNEVLGAMYEQLEAASGMPTAFTTGVGEASFGRFGSKASAYLSLRPFSDDSRLSLKLNYSKHIGLPFGLANEVNVAVEYTTNQADFYPRVRYVALNFVLPSLAEEEFSFLRCQEHRSDLQSLIETAQQEGGEGVMEDLQESLNWVLPCDFMYGLQEHATFSAFVSALAPRFKDVHAALDLLDPRHWAVKLFSGYSINIEDCQGWWKLGCKPSISAMAKAGMHGVTRFWTTLALNERGLTQYTTAYAPTLSTGMFSQGDLDKFLYIWLKDAELWMLDPTNRAEQLQDQQEVLTNWEAQAWFQEFNQMRQEFAEVDWSTWAPAPQVVQARPVLFAREPYGIAAPKKAGKKNLWRRYIDGLRMVLLSGVPAANAMVISPATKQLAELSEFNTAVQDIPRDPWSLNTHDHGRPSPSGTKPVVGWSVYFSSVGWQVHAGLAAVVLVVLGVGVCLGMRCRGRAKKGVPFYRDSFMADWNGLSVSTRADEQLVWESFNTQEYTIN